MGFAYGSSSISSGSSGSSGSGGGSGEESASIDLTAEQIAFSAQRLRVLLRRIATEVEVKAEEGADPLSEEGRLLQVIAKPADAQFSKDEFTQLLVKVHFAVSVA